MLVSYPTKMTIIAILQKALFYLNLAFSLKLINSLNFMKKYEFLQMSVWLTGYSNRCVFESISEIENLESSRAQVRRLPSVGTENLFPLLAGLLLPGFANYETSSDME